MRQQCERQLPQIYHCQQCRADAIGPLHQDVSCLYTKGGSVSQKPAERAPQPPVPQKPAVEQKQKTAADNILLFAIASRDGRLVDQHFGHAEEFYIYAWDNGQVNLKERRPILQFCRGKENCFVDHENKLERLTETLEDCDGVISLRIGDAPRSLLESRGIRVYMTYNKVEDAVRAASEQYKAGISAVFLPV
jgi:predicted Fe-Mo cluster-binding NifX family protein